MVELRNVSTERYGTTLVANEEKIWLRKKFQQCEDDEVCLGRADLVMTNDTFACLPVIGN